MLRKITIDIYMENNEINNWLKEMSEAAVQRCSQKKVFLKYATNLQENTMPKCDLNKVPLQLY